MIRIAVVGDIGSGKSYVAKLFGHPVFNADVEVSKIYKKSKTCYKKLKKKLPNYIISFPIRKKEIAEAILSNKNNLKKIIKIIHPEIRSKMKKFLNKNKNKKIVILDIPLLLENKINKKNDILIYIDSSKKGIKKRLKERINYNPNIVKKLRKIQLPLEIKKKRSNYTIKNNFRRNFAKKNVKIVLKKILINA